MSISVRIVIELLQEALQASYCTFDDELFNFIAAALNSLSSSCLLQEDLLNGLNNANAAYKKLANIDLDLSPDPTSSLFYLTKIKFLLREIILYLTLYYKGEYPYEDTNPYYKV